QSGDSAGLWNVEQGMGPARGDPAGSAERTASRAIGEEPLAGGGPEDILSRRHGRRIARGPETVTAGPFASPRSRPLTPAAVSGSGPRAAPRWCRPVPWATGRAA